jgi:hypothetical protein
MVAMMILIMPIIIIINIVIIINVIDVLNDYVVAYVTIINTHQYFIFIIVFIYNASVGVSFKNQITVTLIIIFSSIKSRIIK